MVGGGLPSQRFGLACCVGNTSSKTDGKGEGKNSFFVFGGVNICQDLSDLWRFEAK